MRGAKLWKRILNEGLNGCSIFAYGEEDSFLSHLLTRPIIVDTRPYNMPKEVEGLFSGIAIPFKEFWIEFDDAFGNSFGGYFINTRADHLNAICVCGEKRGPAMVGQFILPMEDGKFTNETPRTAHCDYEGLAEGEPLKMRNITAFIGYSLMDTLLFMSCKNVGLKKNDNDPKESRRAAKRHGGTPDSYRYHTLIVRPPGAKSDSPGIDIGIMPRHVCRGHFSEYGPEFGKGLLFGKYSGRFFIPPHMKGDKKNGVVEKDYVIPVDAGLGGARIG